MPSPTSSASSSIESASPPAPSRARTASGPYAREAAGGAWPVDSRAGAARARRAVPDDAASDAVLDQRHALLRRALEVERLRQAARVERVVGDRHLLVEDPLADPPGEVAALLEQAERRRSES